MATTRLPMLRTFQRYSLLLLTLSAGPHVLAATDENGQPLPVENSDTAVGQDDSSDAGSDKEAEDQNFVVEKPRVMPDEEHNRHQAVVDYLRQFSRSGELVTMMAGDDRFNGLYLSETAGKPQGAVLILHDTEQHGHWPYVVAPLREQLPASGWATLSIELPTPPEAPVPARPVYSSPEEDSPAEDDDEQAASADNSDSEAQEATIADASDNESPVVDGEAEAGAADENLNADNEPALPKLTGLPEVADNDAPAEAPALPGKSAEDTFRDAMLARISQSVSYLNQRGQLNIVIVATGSSAGWASEYLQQKPVTVVKGKGKDSEEKGYTLVLIDATDHRLNRLPLVQRLTALELPVLDLISPAGITPDWQASQRAGAMRHRQKSGYQQIQVPAFALQYDDNNVLVRRVRGWLKTHAAGTELPTG
jgi:hypothetical protein